MDSTEIEQRFKELEDRVSKLEAFANTPVSPKKTAHSGFEDKLVEVIDDIGPKDLIIISLRIDGPQTKEQIRKTLDGWGGAYGSWFNGGNFHSRLIDKGIVKVDSTGEDGGAVYSLTKKGEKTADKIMEEIKKMGD